ncbi:MAG: 3-hydroxyacyl-[acyl-carrier-protein] dehydratase FabZ [Pseudomonadota bacterium]|nr:3-hydroxyacyl-[acyl-carrier-protein] dehydratase FabZ [Pseudomonadota bacterium]
MRYLLLDRITALEPPARALGIKVCSLSEDFLADHFPGHPVMPGALLLEGLAQLGGVLVEATLRARGRTDLHALLLSADKARFRQLVRPGDRVELEAIGEHATEDGGRVRGIARVEGTVVAEAILTFALVKVTNPRVIERRQEYLNLWLYGQTEAP